MHQNQSKKYIFSTLMIFLHIYVSKKKKLSKNKIREKRGGCVEICMSLSRTGPIFVRFWATCLPSHTWPVPTPCSGGYLGHGIGMCLQKMSWRKYITPKHTTQAPKSLLDTQSLLDQPNIRVLITWMLWLRRTRVSVGRKKSSCKWIPRWRSLPFLPTN